VAWIRQASADEADEPIVVIQNVTAFAQRGYRLGVPRAGRWAEALNTDDPAYGGSGVINARPLQTKPIPTSGWADSIELDLAPLGSILLRPVSPQRRRA